jgi:hypothetical protein
VRRPWSERDEQHAHSRLDALAGAARSAIGWTALRLRPLGGAATALATAGEMSFIDADVVADRRLGRMLTTGFELHVRLARLESP